MAPKKKTKAAAKGKAAARGRVPGKSKTPKKPAQKSARKPDRKAGKSTTAGKGKPDKRKRKGPARGKARKPGKRLSAAQKSVRDTLMLTRKIQGWTWEELAAEHKLSVTAVREAVEKKRKSLPKLLDKEAAEIIEDFVLELQVSIGDFEKIASAAMEGANLPVAVGAKARADAARDQLRELLQSVGTLPHDLGTLTWVIDIRAVVVEINGAVEGFAESMRALGLPKDKQQQMDEGVARVVGRLDEIATSPQTVTSSTTENGGDPDGTQ
jgi:ribosome-binding protein aMBF1 (putative translation factor)